MPYRLNGHDTFKLANPDKREEVLHRYVPHYYMCGNGDVYIVTITGKLFWKGFNRDTVDLVWKPVSSNITIQDWQPVTRLEGICINVEMPYTHTDVLFLTGARTGIYVRRGKVIYEGKCDCRGTKAGKMDYEETPAITETLQMPVWKKDENGKYTAEDEPLNQWTYHRLTYNEIDTNVLCPSKKGEIRWRGEDARGYIEDADHLVWECGEFLDDEMNIKPDDTAPTIGSDNDVDWWNSRVWGHRFADDQCESENTLKHWSARKNAMYCKVGLPDAPTGAYIVDAGNGFALIPYRYQYKDWKDCTFIGQVGAAEDLPGFKGIDASGNILTDWAAIRKYEVRQPDECASTWVPPETQADGEAVPTRGVVRKGLQFTDCFYNAEDDVYWRLEFNGWKSFAGYAGQYAANSRHRANWSETGFDEYVVVLPSMTKTKSAHEQTTCQEEQEIAECSPKYVVHGRDYKQCGGMLLVNEKRPADEKVRYAIFNTETLIEEGQGIGELYCIGKFLVILIKTEGEEDRVRIYCNDKSDGKVWEGTGWNFAFEEDTSEGSENYLNLVTLNGDSQHGWTIRVFCCETMVGAWEYPGGDDQYVYNSNQHIARSWLSGIKNSNYTFVPTVSGYYRIDDCEVLNAESPCPITLDKQSQYVDDWEEHTCGLLWMYDSDDGGYGDSSDSLYAQIDCQPFMSCSGTFGSNYGYSSVMIDVYNVHGPYGYASVIIDTRSPNDPPNVCNISDGQAPFVTVVKQNLKGDDTYFGTSEDKYLSLIAWITYTVQDVLCDFENRNTNSYGWLNWDRCGTVTNPPYTLRIGDARQMHIVSTPDSDVTFSYHTSYGLSLASPGSNDYYQFCGFLRGVTQALCPYCTGYTYHNPYCDCGTPTAITAYKHNRAYANNNALTLLISGERFTDQNGDYTSYTGNKVFTIDNDCKIKSGTTLPIFQLIAGAGQAPMLGNLDNTVINMPRIGTWSQGSILQTGSASYGYQVCVAAANDSGMYCNVPTCASTMSCRFGTLVASTSESIYQQNGGATGVGWSVTFPETQCSIKINPEACLDWEVLSGHGWWRKLVCCSDMVLFLVTNLDNGYNDGTLVPDNDGLTAIYKAHVRIYLSIKGVINKSWSGETVAVSAIDPNDGTQHVFVDADGYVSCECGLNIFEVYIGDKVHETGVYQGTTPTDYEWGICCGDNHLLVGEGTEGWHADITYPEPFDPLNPDDLAQVTFRLDDGTQCTVNEIKWDLVDEIEMTYTPYIDSFKFIDTAGETRVIDPKRFIPYKFIKGENYAVHALTRKAVINASDEFVSDDTIVDVVCWEHQYTENANNVPTTTNSHSAAFLTSGTIDGDFVRTSEVVVDTMGLGEGKIIKIANQIDDNNKNYPNPANSKTKRIHDIFTSYRQKSFERNHRRRGTYIRYNGTTRSANSDFENDGTLKEGIELDFDPHVSSTEDAPKRLYIDDKEAWYRFDTLPDKDRVQAPPVGIDWNHPDKNRHRTAVWSGNGLLYIQHPQDANQDKNVSTVFPNITVDRYGNQYPCPSEPQTLAANVSYDSMEGVAPVEEKIEFAPTTFMTAKATNQPPSSGCGGCGKNISYA